MPHPTSKTTAKDVFSYLLMIIVLIMSVVSFLTIVFQVINVLLPDVTDSWRAFYANEAIRSSIAMLVIAWPVFLLMARFIEKDLIKHHEKATIWVRRWLLHLALFIAAITIIIDLTTTVNSFLSGELTLRFGLKVLAVLAVAAGIFWYYLWELKRDPKEKTTRPKVVAIVASVLVLGWVIGSFFVIGTPAEQRRERMDAQRVSDLGEIQYQIINYYEEYQSLPGSMEDLADKDLPLDPETETSYEYKVTSDIGFELCATFSTIAEDEKGAFGYQVIVESRSFKTDFYEDDSLTDWSHVEGYTCFAREIDPEWFEDNK